jgi:tetratricopeptide (TPR) repeat protein
MGEGVALNNLGSVATSQGDYEQARGYYEQSMVLCHEMDDLEGEGFGLSGLGMLLNQVGDYESSLEYSQQALRLIEEMGDRNILGDVLTNMGNSLECLERLDEAAREFLKAFDLRRELGQYSKADESLAGLARVALAQGALDQASVYIADIVETLEQGMPQGTYDPFRIYLTCYQVLKAQGDPHAYTLLKTAHTLLQEQAARMSSAELRHLFLENVPANHAIVEEFARFFDTCEVGTLANA